MCNKHCKRISFYALVVALLLFPFVSLAQQPSVHPCHGMAEGEAKIQCYVNEDARRAAEEKRAQEAHEREDKRYEAEQAAEEERRAAEAEREAERRKASALKERRRELKDAEKDRRTAIKDLERKCDRAAKDVEKEFKDKKKEAEKWEEEFHKANEKITDLEEKLSEKQVELREKIGDLKNESTKTVQELKDNMGDELKDIDKKVEDITSKIAELNAELEKVEELRLVAFYARRKQQNDFYGTCFTQALQQTEARREKFYLQKQGRAARQQTMGALMTGGAKQTKSGFSAMFNNYLNLCLNNQASLLSKENQKDEAALTQEKLNRQEEGAKKKIVALEAQIKTLQTQGKLEVLSRFKEKMQMELASFNKQYDMLSANYQTSTQQVIKQIEQIKQKQASFLQKRAQAVPKETRSVVLSQKCEKINVADQAFNMFVNQTQQSPQNMGDGHFLGIDRSGVQ